VSEPRRAAAVDIGSTSVHLLVADVSSLGLESVLDVSDLLGLGGRIEARGLLGAEAQEALAQTLAGYADEARRLGAESIAFAGTDPLRHAADAARAVHRIELVSGVPVDVLEQSEEGALTLLGVTGGARHGVVAVIDIGGGSTEIVLAGPDGIRSIVGLPLGASRLSAVVGADDPPSADQVAALRREADRIVARAPDLVLGEVVAVGGTAYGVARVATGPGYGERLVDAEGIALAVAVSGRERSVAVAELFGLNPRRARILPAGTAILAALAERYGIERIRASELGLREGLVRALIRDGRSWRDQLAAGRPGRSGDSPATAREP
jgi:exopolyphosphatase / guanosine-5'-triphosphate,3'-diphosphate pyrophosphatase